jgi:hypothetical protein
MCGTSDNTGGELRAFLAVRDVACPGCGYNLRGLGSNRCAECGLLVDLGVQPRRERWTAVAFVAIACGWPFVTAAMNTCRSLQSAIYISQLTSGTRAQFSAASGTTFPQPSVARTFFQEGVSVYLYTALFTLGLVGVVWMVASRKSGRQWPGRRLCVYAALTFGCHVLWSCWNFLRDMLL